MPHATNDAAELADLICSIADRVAFEAADAGVDAGAATLLERPLAPSEDDAERG